MMSNQVIVGAFVISEHTFDQEEGSSKRGASKRTH